MLSIAFGCDNVFVIGATLTKMGSVGRFTEHMENRAHLRLAGTGFMFLVTSGWWGIVIRIYSR